jgi:hypothetical protein
MGVVPGGGTALARLAASVKAPKVSGPQSTSRPVTRS